VATAASGTASFWLNPEGTQLRYKLTVAELNNVTMAHLHLGAAGKMALPCLAISVRTSAERNRGMSNGVLSDGTITAGDLVGRWQGRRLLTWSLQSGRRTFMSMSHPEHSDGEIRASCSDAD